MNSIAKYNYVVNSDLKPDTFVLSSQGCKFLAYHNVPPVIEAGNGDNRVHDSGGSWSFICHTKNCWLLNHSECSIAEKEPDYQQTYTGIKKIVL